MHHRFLLARFIDTLNQRGWEQEKHRRRVGVQDWHITLMEDINSHLSFYVGYTFISLYQPELNEKSAPLFFKTVWVGPCDIQTKVTFTNGETWTHSRTNNFLKCYNYLLLIPLLQVITSLLQSFLHEEFVSSKQTCSYLVYHQSLWLKVKRTPPLL